MRAGIRLAAGRCVLLYVYVYAKRHEVLRARDCSRNAIKLTTRRMYIHTYTYTQKRKQKARHARSPGRPPRKEDIPLAAGERYDLELTNYCGECTVTREQRGNWTRVPRALREIDSSVAHRERCVSRKLLMAKCCMYSWCVFNGNKMIIKIEHTSPTLK